MAAEPGNTGDKKPAEEPTLGTGETSPAPTASPAPDNLIAPSVEIAAGAVPAAAPAPGATPAPSVPPQAARPRPAGKRAAGKLVEPSLSARSTDRLSAMNPPPKRRGGGGCFTFLLLLAIVAGAGYWLWRDGRLDPLITWAKPYTEKLQPIIARIEALIPGHQPEAPAPDSNEAMVQEIKQILAKLDFQPGPINGTLDPATVAAIEAYQETAGLPIDGQPSQELLNELRAVAAQSPSSN